MGVWIVGVKPCTGDLPKLRKTLLNKSDGVCLENFIVIESGDITDKWIQVEKKKKIQPISHTLSFSPIAVVCLWESLDNRRGFVFVAYFFGSAVGSTLHYFNLAVCLCYRTRKRENRCVNHSNRETILPELSSRNSGSCRLLHSHKDLCLIRY